jgi:hypothetical protein
VSISIHEVDTSKRRQVNAFLRLPFRLYADTPQWVPPLWRDARLQLDRQRHPFYRENDAAFFVARRNGEIEGRICAMHPRRDNAIRETEDAYFYLFECVDDQQVAGALFEAAAQWATGRGLTGALRGPLGFMAADGFGLLAEGFEHRPAVGIPYNPPYYVRLVEGVGFAVEERHLSGYISGEWMRASFSPRVMDIAEKVKQRYGFRTKTFDSKREVRRWVAPRLAELYERAFTHVSRDRHLTPEQVDAITRRLMLVSDPKLLKFVTKGDEVVGFVLCFLDVSAGIQRARGRLWPFGWYHILRDARRTSWVNVNGIGILPEYQGRGGSALMYAELYQAIALQERLQHGEVIQIAESNHKSLNEMKNFGTRFYKTHHVYRKPL